MIETLCIETKKLILVFPESQANGVGPFLRLRKCVAYWYGTHVHVLSIWKSCVRHSYPCFPVYFVVLH
jgi:hypothetical protein